MNTDSDFDYVENACYLNEQGRKKYLRAFVQRMEEELQVDDHEQPRWDLLTQQVKAYKQFIYDPTHLYKPYLIR
jgi:CRISPR-associated protein Cas1